MLFSKSLANNLKSFTKITADDLLSNLTFAQFVFLLKTEQKPEECDATEDQ